MDKNSTSWTNWVIGTLGATTFLFGTLYIQNVNANFEELKSSNSQMAKEQKEQGQKIISIEERQKTLIEKMDQFMDLMISREQK